MFNGANKFNEGKKGADMFQRPRQTKKQAAGKGTSRYLNWWSHYLLDKILMIFLFLKPV